MEKEMGINLNELIRLCQKSNKKITVKEATDLIQLSFSLLYNEGTVLKDTEKELGEEKFNILLTSILTTLLANIYSNSKIEKKNTQKK